MIWLIGNKGMLGSEIELQLKKSGMNYASSDMDVDITDRNSVEKFVEGKNIKWMINCAAYTAVDNAEDDVEKAYLINETGPKCLAESAVGIKAKLIHISTDYVFSGTDPSVRHENDVTSPVSVYGKSKLAGENVITKSMTDYFIIRTAWLYGVNGNNFVYTMLRLMNQKDEIKVVNDQIGSPTNAEDLAHLIVAIVKSDSDDFGIYHFSNEGEISWHDFAVEIYRLGIKNAIIKSQCEIKKCLSSEYTTKAVRPAFSLLCKDKVRKVFSFDVQKWKASLEKFFERADFDTKRIL